MEYFVTMNKMSSAKKTYDDSEFLLEVIHNFVGFTAAAETPQEVYFAITKNFLSTLHIQECVVYEAIPQEKKLVQRAIHGTMSPQGEMTNNLKELKYGEGVVGWVAENQQTVCISDTRKDKRYIKDRLNTLSELSVPIQFNGELFGVLDSESSEVDYYTEKDVHLFQLIADLAANLLVRIRQKSELNDLKNELEKLLDQKKKDLELAIEQVNDQEFELESEKEKQELLLKEVHHRVNNNLQILTSIISIYLSREANITVGTLEQIQQKIQTLSAIHLILLKSVEKDDNTVHNFLLDLFAAMRYINPENYLIVETSCEVEHLSMNTLIPLGLLLNELISKASSTFWKKGEPVELHVCLCKHEENYSLDVYTSDTFVFDKEKLGIGGVQDILIDALTHQLEGQFLEKGKRKTSLWTIDFENQD